MRSWGVSELELDSGADFEVLRRSGRSKVLALLVVGGTALAAAGWYFTREQGTGNPEDAAKVLLVGSDPDTLVMLEEGGFEVDGASFEKWTSKAHEQVPDLDADADGVESIMRLADRYGYGYVVFERPHELDFSRLELESAPTLSEEVGFAVVSAGDLAFPHAMTIATEPSPILREFSLEVLEALFAQEALDEIALGKAIETPEAIERRRRLRPALERLEQLHALEQQRDAIISDLRQRFEHEERAEPPPRMLGELLESGTPFPLANGRILMVSRGFEIISPDGVELDAQTLGNQVWHTGSTEDAPSERTRCDVMEVGALALDRNPRYWFGADGASLLANTLTRGYVQWALAPQSDGCEFTKQGPLPRPVQDLYEAEPAAHGQVARAGAVLGTQVISVVTAQSGDEQRFGRLHDTTLDAVAWLDERHLVALGIDGRGAGLYFVDTAAPGTILHLPSRVFDGAKILYELAVGNRGEQPVIVVTAGRELRRPFRLELPQTVSSLFTPPAEPPTDDALEDPELRRPPVVTLDPSVFEVIPLAEQGQAWRPSVSANGAWVAFAGVGDHFDAFEPGDAEIVVVPATGGTPRVLTQNSVRDTWPRLTPDGSHVVFESQADIDGTNWRVTVSRIATVEGD